MVFLGVRVGNTCQKSLYLGGRGRKIPLSEALSKGKRKRKEEIKKEGKKGERERKYISKIQNDSFICRMQIRRNKINPILYLIQSLLVDQSLMSLSSNTLNEIWFGFYFFLWSVGLKSELIIYSKPYCKQMCCHPGFVVPFIEHRLESSHDGNWALASIWSQQLH